MGRGLRFEILGPLRVSVADREIAITAGRERALLATLLLSPNRVVPVTQLVEVLWSERAPVNARNQLHGCVSRLRRRLAAADTGNVIATEPAGYRVVGSQQTVDVLEFRVLAAAARVAVKDGRQQEARDTYRRALELWRGPALAGVDRDAVRRAAAGLEEERARALEERIELELALGGGRELVGELTELVHQFPYREHLHGALMRALYRADRQADALAAYQRIRRTLVEDLGQEPGPALRQLHQRVLAGDESLRTLRSASNPGDAAPPVNHCLPRTVPDFTGRDAELSWLVGAADHANPYAPLVLTLDGMAGVGKTSLAVHAAHLLTPRYPDGQLFLDLRGHSEDQPLEPAAALETLLRQLGIPATHIPTGLEERAARWRTELASRRVLVVLDNAASTAQVTPLLPTGAGCLALITSRRRLLDLDGAQPHAMGTLAPDEAVRLLERIIGQRARADPEAAADVAKRCGCLPLALRLAGARLAHRPGWRVRDLADRLAGSSTPLAELSAGDRSVADAFALSYAHLTPGARRLFRVLSLHPGEHFDAYIAAALAGISLEDAQQRLDELVDGHLVGEPLAHRYHFHDLVREYATALAQREESPAERTRAFASLLDYYLHAVTSACAGLETENSQRNLRQREPMRTDLTMMVDRFDADWLEAERRAVTAAVQQAAADGHPEYTWQLARAMSRFLHLRGYLDDLVVTHRHGLAAADQLGDRDATATMHNYLAGASYVGADYNTAIAHARKTLALREATGDNIGTAMARRNLATVYAEAGYHGDAVNQFQRALAAARTSDNASFLAHTVANVGDTYLTIGRYALAAKYSRHGLGLARQIGDIELLAVTLGNLGMARIHLGEPEAARRLLRCALTFRRRVSDRLGEAECLNGLGVVHRMIGEFQAAVTYHHEGLAIVQESGYRCAECKVNTELGRTWYAAGDGERALELHQRALAGAVKIQHRYHEARALDGMAACLRDADPEDARRHWRRALHLYQELEVPERHDVARHLATLGG